MKKGPVSSWSAIAALGSTCTLLFAVLLLTASLSSPTYCQDDDPEGVPPPVKLIPKAEKDQLAAESDLKDRTKLTLEFMEAHLLAAEKLSGAGDARGTFRELGRFEGLMDDSLAVLERNNSGSGKVLDAYRKLEIGLRGFMPRLETVRRGLPLECDEYVRGLMHSVRDARAKAVDPLFSDNVVRVKSD